MSVPVKTLETTLGFGKYRGWTVDQVLDENPGYISWCLDQRIFALDDDADEALMAALARFKKERNPS